jgi:hypothetical protein
MVRNVIFDPKALSLTVVPVGVPDFKGYFIPLDGQEPDSGAAFDC